MNILFWAMNVLNFLISENHYHASGGRSVRRMIFRINVGYILYCQVHIISVVQIKPFYLLLLHELHAYQWVMQASLFLSSFWVTDFSLLGGNYCINESLNDINILLLNFISVLYPLLLMISMYTLIELHGS